MLTLIPRLFARLSLTLMLVLSGLMVCIHVPFVTEFLSQQTSFSTQFDVSQETIAKASLATRDYALGTIGTEGLKTTLNGLGLPENGLDSLMLTHLQDCTWIFRLSTNLFMASLIVSLASIVLTAILVRSNGVYKLLWQSSLLSIIIISVFAIWIATSFDSFFTWMHSLFFQGGTWTFSVDSLLICMFPEKFWIGMGIVWGSVSVISSILTIFVAKLISAK